MASITLAPEPTFDAQVPIPVPGGKSVDVRFTFIWRGKEEYLKFSEEKRKQEDYPDPQLVMDIATGWSLTDEFTRENVAKLLDKYGGSASAIYLTYTEELVKVRTKN